MRLGHGAGSRVVCCAVQEARLPTSWLRVSDRRRLVHAEGCIHVHGNEEYAEEEASLLGNCRCVTW